MRDKLPLVKGRGGPRIISLRFGSLSKRKAHRPPPRATVHALVTASRSAGGVSRHPAPVYTPMPLVEFFRQEAHYSLRIFSPAPHLVNARSAAPPPPPSYRPYLEKRRRRFEAPLSLINAQHAISPPHAIYQCATCHKPPTCRTRNLCPSSTFINWAKNVQQH